MAIQFCSEDTYNRRLNTSSTGSANGVAASSANGGASANSASNLSAAQAAGGGQSLTSTSQDFSALHDEKLYSSAAAAAAAAAAVSSAVPEVASVLSPSQLVGYPGALQKSSPSPVGSQGPLDPSEVFCPTSAAAAAAAAFSFPGYNSGPASSECTPKTEDTTKDN